MSKFYRKIQEYSNFYCTCCGSKGIPIVRKTSKQKEPGHLKKLYCLNCKTEQNMVEIKSNSKYTVEDFYLEFENGNFLNGQRILPFKQFLKQLKERGYNNE